MSMSMSMDTSTSPDPWDWLGRFPDHEMVIGPIQRSEALMMYGLVRVLRPLTVVELGFYKGDSAAVLAAATADIPGARVVSHDIHVDWTAAAELQSRYPHVQVRECDQRMVDADLGDAIDFLFVDASHDLRTNQDTWAALQDRMAANAVVMVHDTGLWVDPHRPPQHTHGCPGTANGVAGRFHQPCEVRFVNWLVDTHPDWVKMDFWSSNTFRHGLTLLQRKRVETMA